MHPWPVSRLVGNILKRCFERVRFIAERCINVLNWALDFWCLLNFLRLPSFVLNTFCICCTFSLQKEIMHHLWRCEDLNVRTFTHNTCPVSTNKNEQKIQQFCKIRFCIIQLIEVCEHQKCYSLGMKIGSLSVS